MLLLLGSCGCAHQSRQTGSTISKTEALKLAKLEFAKLYPERVGEYDIRVVEDSDHGVWSVWFQGRGKYAMPGGYTLINVNKATGTTEVAPSDRLRPAAQPQTSVRARSPGKVTARLPEWSGWKVSF